MPLDRAQRLTDQTVEMRSADDIGLVFDALRRIPERGFFTKERAQRDIAEEVGYQLLVNPSWIRPHVTQLVQAGVAAAMTFEWQCLLMDGAPEALLDVLVANRNSDGQLARETIDLLLASRDGAALEAVAEQAAGDVATARECRELGFERPSHGTLVPRFTISRCALRLLLGKSPEGALHAIGLPLDQVAAPSEQLITFHYLSVTPSAFPPLPTWPGPAHLVAPRHWPDWTLFGEPDDAGRLHVLRLDFGEDRSLDTDLRETLDAAAKADQAAAAVELVAFDDGLTYANQHPMLTTDVIGILGGPPMGLAPTPACPTCGRIMFHIARTDTHAREYGDGFRSLFVCEDCRVAASLATLWN